MYNIYLEMNLHLSIIEDIAIAPNTISKSTKSLSATVTHASDKETYELVMDFKSYNPFGFTPMNVEEECQYSPDISFMVITKLPTEFDGEDGIFHQLAIMFYTDIQLVDYCGYATARYRREAVDAMLNDMG